MVIAAGVDFEVVVGQVVSPEKVYGGFEWKVEFAQPGPMVEQTERFLGEQGVGLELSAEAVVAALEHNLVIAKEWYEAVYPESEMKYHDLGHARATAYVGMKMFLGKLAGLAESGQVRLNGEECEKVVKTYAAVVANHERDEWWQCGLRPGGDGCGARVESVSGEIDSQLENQGIDVGTFERLLTLDDFTRPLNETLGEFEKGGVAGLGLSVSDEQVMLIVRAMGEATVAADFGQICNSKYSELVEIEMGEERHLVWRGLAALAWEFQEFRPKALTGAGWEKRDEPGKIDWEKVAWVRGFYERLAYPRIMQGLIGLWAFDENEGRRMWEWMNELEGQFVD